MQIRELRPGEATPEYAEKLGLLMPDLSAGHDGGPIDLANFENGVNSPSVGWLIAIPNEIDQSRALSRIDIEHPRMLPIVGQAVLTEEHGSLGHNTARLQDFVVSREFQGLQFASGSLAYLMWREMNQWRRERGLWTMRFTSAETRESAHRFYLSDRIGCVVEDRGQNTTYFRHDLD